MNCKTHSPSCATNGLNIGARVIVLAQRQSLGFRSAQHGSVNDLSAAHPKGCLEYVMPA